MNNVILVGRLARDPELSYTPNTQMAVCRFTLAVDRPRRKEGEQGADFIRVTVFDRQAENCNKYLAKGRQAAVKGRIQTGSYKNRQGETVYTTDVIADAYEGVQFLGGGNGENRGSDARNNGNEATYQPQPQNAPYPQNSFDMPDSFSSMEDDIPF